VTPSTPPRGPFDRVLFVNATRNWGGEKTWALETAQCLEARGYSCLMVGRPHDRWVTECGRAGLDSRALRFGPAIFNPLGVRGLHRIVRRYRPDCILVNISRDMCAGAVAGLVNAVPVIRHVGLAEDLNHDPVDWWLHARALAGTIVVGHRMRQQVLRDFSWLDPDSVHVVPIGKDIEVFRPGCSHAVRQAWHLPDDALVVGVTSQLGVRKGHAVLLDALARLRDPRLHAVVVGEGECAAALERRAKALGIADRVRFTGFSREIPDVLRGLDVFVLPSLCEGFPNTLVEAMSTGLPCIATSLGCISEIVDHGRNGLLVAPGDAEALATALRQLIADPARRRALGSGARRRVETGFGLEATTDGFVAVVSTILQTRRPRGRRR